MFEDIANDILGFFPDEILGLPKMAFFGLLLGISVACYEGIYKKFDKYKTIKVKDKELAFNKKYLLSGIIAIAVTFITVYLVMDSGILTGVTSFAVAFAIGMAEGGQTIKYLNTRLDIFSEKSMKKLGATEDEAKEIAKAVEFVEVKDEPKKDDGTAKPPSVSFEEL